MGNLGCAPLKKTILVTANDHLNCDTFVLHTDPEVKLSRDYMNTLLAMTDIELLTHMVNRSEEWKEIIYHFNVSRSLSGNLQDIFNYISRGGSKTILGVCKNKEIKFDAIPLGDVAGNRWLPILVKNRIRELIEVIDANTEFYNAFQIYYAMIPDIEMKTLQDAIFKPICIYNSDFQTCYLHAETIISDCNRAKSAYSYSYSGPHYAFRCNGFEMRISSCDAKGDFIANRLKLLMQHAVLKEFILSWILRDIRMPSNSPLFEPRLIRTLCSFLFN
jgi:hypothetical protein